MRIAVFLACIALAFARGPGERVSGGNVAPVGSRPYMAAILYSNYAMDQFCGGALIHPQWVITSATCAGYSDDVYVGLGYYNLENDGSADGAVLAHGTWHKNPSYGNDPFYANDIALIKLDSAVSISGRIGIVNMPADGITPSDGTSMLVTGWGLTSTGGNLPSDLSQTVVTVSSLSVCTDRYGTHMDATLICSDNTDQDFCQGDDGGPAVTNYDASSSNGAEVIQGIASRGHGCLTGDVPSLYTRISAHCSWIDIETDHVVKCK